MGTLPAKDRYIYNFIHAKPGGHVVDEFDKRHGVIIKRPLPTRPAHPRLKSLESIVDLRTRRNGGSMRGRDEPIADSQNHLFGAVVVCCNINA